MRSFSAIAYGTAVVCLIAPALAHAQQSTTLNGQIRPRFEYRDESGGAGDSFVSMRTRLGLDVRLDDQLSVYVEGQDVRIWGEELHPNRDYRADGLDVHEAFLRYRPERLGWLSATVGRQETRFGGERLVGAVDWSQQGQTFDGARLDVFGDQGRAALIGYVLADESAAPATEDRQLFGVYGTRDEVGPGALDVYWLYGRARDGAAETDEHALGARYAFDGRIHGRFEATLQSGSRSDADVSAFMVGARLGVDFADERATATLWYDYLSGDDPGTPEVEVFNTFYGTNHKFYGLADVFTNIPLHTDGAGLQDLAVKLSWAPDADLLASVDVHSFWAANDAGLSDAHLADEIDLSVRLTLTADLDLTTGASFVFQDDPLAEIGRLAGDQQWLYVMLDAAF